MARTSLFWGAVLFILGILLLLSNLGIINVDIWGLIWPVFLIALGLWVLWGITQRGKHQGEQISIPVDGAQKARLTLKHGAGELEVTSGSGADLLVSGSFGGGADVRTDRLRDELRATLSMPPQFMPFFYQPGSLDWRMQVTDGIPLDLRIEGGASRITLDLTNLKLAHFELHTGASASDVRLPARAGFTTAKVEAGAASVKFIVPAGVAARIRTGGGLSSNQIDQIRFPRSGGVYQSPDYETATNKIEIEVSSGVGSIQVMGE